VLAVAGAVVDDAVPKVISVPVLDWSHTRTAAPKEIDPVVVAAVTTATEPVSPGVGAFTRIG